MTKTHTISLISGDGIGPEVVGATRKIIEAAGVKVNWDECEAGEQVFRKGLSTGVPQATIDSIAKNKVALKGPLSTPIGFGEKSANVTLRKLFETYGNIRPVREIPGVPTPFAGRGLDFVIVRENVEDLYAGIEHMQSPGVAQCLKVISRKGSEKIMRLAFEFARSEGRKKIHCATKANIMKLTEGLVKRTFEDVAKEYSDIEAHHIIVDNCAHMLAKQPEMFDVIVTTNMNGDILSDLGSGLIGGLGFAPGANIGDGVAIFEAVHGSAPKYAGQNNINPTAVLMSGVMMLRYLGEFEAADAITQALYCTMARDGMVTRDVKIPGKDPVSTTAFTDQIIKNLGQKYNDENRPYKPIGRVKVSEAPDFVKTKSREITGVDIFVETAREMIEFGPYIEKIADKHDLALKLISCRGVKVFPSDHGLSPDMTDVVRCRFIHKKADQEIKDNIIGAVLQDIAAQDRWMHIEKLQSFDGVLGYSKAHGED